MTPYLKIILITGLACYLCACQFTAKNPLIVLDSGHNPTTSTLGTGAMSVTGVPEVAYNDRFSGELAKALQDAGFDVVLTRTPDKEQGLKERYEIANSFKWRHSAIFISIHHDSTELQNLKEIIVNDITTYQTIRPIAGTSFHISRESKKYNKSLTLANHIAKAVKNTGRTLNMEHASDNNVKPLPLVVPDLAIYRHDNLAVLKNNELPALLIEVGVIVDKDDESLVSDDGERARLAGAIVAGVKGFYELK